MPNFVRASVIPISAIFVFGKDNYGITTGGVITATLVILIALAALWRLEETFRKDLDYSEE